MALIKLSYPFPWGTISEAGCNVLRHYNMRKCAICYGLCYLSEQYSSSIDLDAPFYRLNKKLIINELLKCSHELHYVRKNTLTQ
jgi:hypothetical protein